MGGDEKKFSWRKPGIRAAQIAGKTTNDRKLSVRSCFPRLIKIPLSDFEKVIAEQQFCFRFDQLGLHVFEIDGLNRLLNVQIPLRSSRRIGAVPIENSISRIAILLDFYEQISSTDRMHPAGREKNGIACLNTDIVDVIDHNSLA